MKDQPKCDLRQVVLLRHGESVWNKENRFTGWTDVDLSDHGREEARIASRILKEHGLMFDVAVTSVLKRAIWTLWIVLDEMDLMWVSVLLDWRLNEHHYGALQGLNKSDTARQFGEGQVRLWRRSYNIRPPALDVEDSRHPCHDSRYKHLVQEQLPATECLKEVVMQFLSCWHEYIVPLWQCGQTVLIVAHGNSLRALIKYLDDVSETDIADLNIPTGIPLMYELDDDLHAIRHYYLGDPVRAQSAMQAGRTDH
jgi:2,3-bisphosphoglycerate-dependent phosphoglycerate mutase